jgi:hypothetical protein
MKTGHVPNAGRGNTSDRWIARAQMDGQEVLEESTVVLMQSQPNEGAGRSFLLAGLQIYERLLA